MSNLTIFIIYISGVVATLALGALINKIEKDAMPTGIAVFVSIFSYLGFIAMIISLFFSVVITTIVNMLSGTSFDDWYRGIK